MPTYKQAAQKQQARFRDKSGTISSPAGYSNGGKRHNYILAQNYECENLYPTLRGRNGVIKFFKERRINWHHGGAANRMGGPTRNMTGSQVACVNFLLPLSEIQDALAVVVRAIDRDVRDIVAIRHKDNLSPVEFEWIGLGGPLELGEAKTRGANVTNVDAFMVAKTSAGIRRAYLIEWKYTEENKGEYYGEGSKGETRRLRYKRLYAESPEFNGNVPMNELLYEPFCQLMRLRLL